MLYNLKPEDIKEFSELIITILESEELKRLARATADLTTEYYNRLIEHGFTDEYALALTLDTKSRIMEGLNKKK